MKHAWLRRMAESLPPGDDDAVKELLWLMKGNPGGVGKHSLYNMIAWSTGLTHTEIGALETEMRSEHREIK